MAEKMKCFRLVDDINFPERWYLGDVRKVDNWSLVAGTPVRAPASVLPVEIYEEGAAMDFTLTETYGVPIVSAKARQAIGQVEGVTFLPVAIKGAAHLGEFFAMVVESTVDCVDEQHSEFEKFESDDPVRPDQAGQFKAFYKLAVDRNKARASGKSVFRLGRFETAIIVDDSVRARLASAKATGVKTLGV